MTFTEAKKFVLPTMFKPSSSWARFHGKTLDEVAEDDDGLLALDWLRGREWVNKLELGKALDAYLGDKTIAKELEQLVGG